MREDSSSESELLIPLEIHGLVNFQIAECAFGVARWLRRRATSAQGEVGGAGDAIGHERVAKCVEGVDHFELLILVAEAVPFRACRQGKLRRFKCLKLFGILPPPPGSSPGGPTTA